MIQIYSENVTVAENAMFPFLTVPVITGRATRIYGSTIHLGCPGFYKVSVNCSVVPEATGTVAVQLAVNGVPQAQGYAEASGTAAETTNLAFTTIVPVQQASCNGCAAPVTLSLVNAGGSVTGDMNIVVI